MLKKDLIDKNPLRVLSPDSNGDTVTQRMGLVMARAGLGKTAILVQIALDSLLRGKQVLHVSLGQSLEKTRTWYDDIFKVIAESAQLDNAAAVHDEIMRNRIIMTFNETSFSRPKFEERLNDLIYQNIFRPDCLVVDGFDFTTADREVLNDLRDLMTAMDLQIWFTAVSHREDERLSKNGVPAPCHEVDDLFDTVILLQVESTESIALNVVKDSTGSAAAGKLLKLDPSTLLIKEG